MQLSIAIAIFTFGPKEGKEEIKGNVKVNKLLISSEGWTEEYWFDIDLKRKNGNLYRESTEVHKILIKI